MDGKLLGVAALIVAGLMMSNQGDAPPSDVEVSMIDGPPPDEGGASFEGDQGGEGLGFLNFGWPIFTTPSRPAPVVSTPSTVSFTFWATRVGWRRDYRGRLTRIGNDATLQRLLRPEYTTGRRINAMSSGQGRQGSLTETLYIQGWANVSGLYGVNVRNWLAGQLVNAIRSSGMQITSYGFSSYR